MFFFALGLVWVLGVWLAGEYGDLPGNGIWTLGLGMGWVFGIGKVEGRVKATLPFIVDRNRTMYEDNFEIK